MCDANPANGIKRTFAGCFWERFYAGLEGEEKSVFVVFEYDRSMI